ncbi:hypothetical protein Sa4125_24880 [Aureimonas sp. SA4125]|uniref:hypothetical protein n=1 Tax=Aureimonas sp. SA4125 TaxID=2826993 RepID=UPI001CC500EE|nr:hypothetical protein [Aureimonas sp. SA4125]BDA84946.1 hypothetical protein Sa4125_24880 [Aureimonas sp. SA4125]
MDVKSISKGIAGAVAGMVTGTGGALVMTPEQVSSMPWWGILAANAIYAAIGFATVYFAPRNTAS